MPGELPPGEIERLPRERAHRSHRPSERRERGRNLSRSGGNLGTEPAAVSWTRILFAMSSPDAVPAAVIDKVGHLASALGAEVGLFHPVVDPQIAQAAGHGSLSDDVESYIGRCADGQRAQLERVADQLRAQGLRVGTSVRWDYPAYEGIVRQALQHGSDLLIAQSTRTPHAAPLFLTHTDFKLIETCPCPLLLLKTSRPYMHGHVVAAVDPLHAHDEPAALDDAILDAARVVAGALSAEILLLHARAPWSVAGLRAALRRDPATEGDEEAAYRGKVQARVRELARRHQIKDDSVFVVEGFAVQVVPAFAREHSADIVIMGAVSRSLLKRILIGHTAERLLDALDCDLLIVKPPGFRMP